MSSPTFRRAALAGSLLLTACQRSEEGASESAERDMQPIYCALGAGRAAPDCRMEIVEDAQSRVLILSMPDGALRRLRVGEDGALSTADGTLDARTARVGAFVGVVLGDERYAVPTSALRGTAVP
jgi:hypothetical protein